MPSFTSVDIERAEAALAQKLLDAQKRGLVAQRQDLEKSQNRLVFIFTILLAVSAIGLFVLGIYLHETERPIRGTLAYAFGLGSFLTCISCVRRKFQIRDEFILFLGEILDSPPKQIVRELRHRARQLRTNAQFTLLMIIVSLAAGLYFFVYAGSIASIDRELALRSEAKSQVDYEQRQLDFERQRLELRRQYESPTSSSAGFAASIEDLKTQFKQLAQKLTDTSSTQESNLEQAKLKQQLFTTTVTRLGSIIILLFLVQILVTLYRYNVRAAAFYDGRADAILMNTDQETLTQLVEIFTPSLLDFGKMPSTPFHAVLETAKEVTKTGIRTSTPSD